MNFQRSAVHWKRGIKPRFVIGPPVYHRIRVMSQDLNKNIQNAEEAQTLLWASMIRIYLKHPRPYYRRIHGLNATTWIIDSYLPHADITVPLPVNIIAHTQCRFKQITVQFLHFNFPGKSLAP